MGIQVARRNSPKQTHDMNGIYHMCISVLFCKPTLCFVLSCGIQVALMSSVESIPFPKWCSHISMGMLILFDHRDGHANPFSTDVLLQVDLIIFNIRKINSKFSQRYPFHLPKLSLFFPPSHPFSRRTRIS